MILSLLIFRAISPELPIHSQQAFDVAFLVSRIQNYCLANSLSEFLTAVLLSAITLLSFAPHLFRIVFVFSSMLSECFFSFWFAEARTPANGKHTLRVYGQVQLVTQSECSAGSSNPCITVRIALLAV
jgi:hypothetical protein